MKRFSLFRPSLALLGMLATVPLWALDVEVGQQVRLQATNPLGVPLHREARPSLAGRAPDGAIGEVLELDATKHWLKVRVDPVTEGWIVEKYVAEVLAPGQPALISHCSGPVDGDEWLVWGSADGCKSVVGAGRCMAPDDRSRLRVGSWNIRWFPDSTNLDWLACTISWMNLDVLAVQEIRDTPEARSAMRTLLEGLAHPGGSSWKITLQECGAANAQHVGFLWDDSSVALTQGADLWELNPRASQNSSPCAGSLRPGRHAYIASVGGGVDFHGISVHTKSGANLDAHAERAQALDRIDQAVADLLTADTDVVVLGDFNTMGHGVSGSATQEIDDFARTVEEEDPGFRVLTAAPGCTEYYRGHPGWLDHAIVSATMAEGIAPTSTVTGYCAVKSCAHIGSERPAAYTELSDHCPVVFEIENEDFD